MATMVKAKLSMRDLGNPKAVTGKPEGDNSPLYLGMIYGIARGVRTRVDDKGEVDEALKGDFEGERAEALKVDGEPDVTHIRSGICYLPSGFHDQMVTAVKETEGGVSFKLRVLVRKATNPIGYEYAMQPVAAPEIADPLASLRALEYKPEQSVDNAEKQASHQAAAARGASKEKEGEQAAAE